MDLGADREASLMWCVVWLAVGGIGGALFGGALVAVAFSMRGKG